MDPRLKAAKEAAWERYKSDPNITGVSVGYKYVGGVKTDEVSVVVYVKRKLPPSVLPASLRVDKKVDGVSTDVQQADTFKKLSATGKPLELRPESLTQRLRPCPAGYSVGHVAITAGTIGAYVQRDGQTYILSNNHVLANENVAVLGDDVLQPGPHDGGVNAANRFATLSEFVDIRFDGQAPGDPTPPGGGWWSWLVAILRWLFGWLTGTRASARNIPQPYPNLVDAALALVNSEADVLREVGTFGPITGIRDAVLGERIKKGGRTTEYTFGLVDAIDGTVKVEYDGGVASFAHQVFLRSTTGQAFSAGGDSGSAILSENNELVGLLFAGGGSLTIANRISDAQRLLGFTL